MTKGKMCLGIIVGMAFVFCAMTASAETPAKAMPAAAMVKSSTEVKHQETCPVMGGKIDKSVYTDYKGKRVYFCCPSCIDTFKKDPEKYIKKMEDEGITLDKTPQTICPITGNPIDKSQYVDVNGKRVYVCCPACIAKVKADPEKFIKELEAKGMTVENAPVKEKDEKK